MRSDAVAGPAPTRAELVADAVERWSGELAALGGRDPLLSYRDLKVGTLDLAAAEPEARKQLLEGEPVLVSKLFPYEPLRTSALRSVRAIRDKSRELAEERGLAVCHLAVGIATWANPFAARRPTAPVMLRPAVVEARDPAETDFTITIADDPFVNPVLLWALDTQLGLRFATDDLRDPAGRLRYATVVERLREFAPPHVVDGFAIAHRAVLATFTTVPLALSRDLAALGVDLQGHDVVAALAGDPGALAAVARSGSPAELRYRVLDTDGEQDDVVAAAVGDGHLRVSAAPGTGRTQTVAALVAELVGRGQRVLVVGEKRAVLDDLVTRLDSVGLRDVVLDAGRTPAVAAVQQIAGTARRLRQARPGEFEHITPGTAAALAAELDAYRDAIHAIRQPWGSTAHEAMVLVATAQEFARTPARVDPDVLARAGSTAHVRLQLRDFANIEGLTLTESGSPWFGSDVPDIRAADALLGTVTELRERALPRLKNAATRAAVEVGLAGPNTVAECLETVDLLASVGRTVETLGAQIWDEPLGELAVATGDRAYRSAHGAGAGFLARRKLRKRLADLTGKAGRPDRSRQHEGLIAAERQLTIWRERSRDGKPPRTGPHLANAVDAAKGVRHALATLADGNPRTADLEDLSFADVAKRLDELIADSGHLRALPRLYELQAELSAAGLDDLIAELRRRGIGADQVEAVFDYAWYSSLLDLWRSTDPALGRFDRYAHERRLEEFRAADMVEVRAAAGRVLEARRARFADIAEQHEGQTAVLTESPESALPASPRALVEEAPELALAAVPCWVASPLTVAELLPPRPLFDVVVVEDAGRLAVAEAIAAVARGARVVLVGDDDVARPPFTTAVEPAPDPDSQEGPWAQDPPPSVVDLLRGALPERQLTGQHRVRDDRLVGFAARTTHAGRLTTVPGVGGADRVTMQIVDSDPIADDPVDSSSDEVNRVVELVLDHVRTRPHESLGVVTLGPRHAERLDVALRHALIRAPEVAPHLRGDRVEPFFIKDVERVSGDVRDAIILTLGYGRSVDGRILYRFGALGRPGGERRLSAATLCSRERLTVVATFGADDLSPRRLTTPGAQALGQFLAYVQQGPQPDWVEGPTPAPGRSGVLAETVAERLQEAGVAAEIVLGHGGPGGVAVAVRHPTRRSRFVLAIETDGETYAARRNARERERLRQEQLTRLGWAVHRIWSAAWAADPDAETERLLAAYEQAVKDADAYDWAVAAAEADIVAGMPEDEPLPAQGSGAAASPRPSVGQRPPVGRRTVDSRASAGGGEADTNGAGAGARGAAAASGAGGRGSGSAGATTDSAGPASGSADGTSTSQAPASGSAGSGGSAAGSSGPAAGSAGGSSASQDSASGSAGSGGSVAGSSGPVVGSAGGSSTSQGPASGSAGSGRSTAASAGTAAGSAGAAASSSPGSGGGSSASQDPASGAASGSSAVSGSGSAGSAADGASAGSGSAGSGTGASAAGPSTASDSAASAAGGSSTASGQASVSGSSGSGASSGSPSTGGSAAGSPGTAASGAADSTSGPASGGPTAIDAAEAEPEPVRQGNRPLIVSGRPVSDYTGRELAALARWTESDGIARRVDDVVGLLATDLSLDLDDARTADVLRHAVRVARAGSPAT
ncbi:DUF4011 domain-containing protein [Jiangella anatolica]|uniref:Restriction endonuclease type II-like domain-containing protein n=1 Tax=Jiangella anatolica TaxID=2670374 RepID=A0A2W2CUR6_9ACTN|nr:DUF4011 domain-containing protein [Jiangella anatolica]PZF83923.1 hypothetical protein C1I92_10705 [Jiangella anatolica]